MRKMYMSFGQVGRSERGSGRKHLLRLTVDNVTLILESWEGAYQLVDLFMNYP